MLKSKLEEIEAKFLEIEKNLVDPDQIADPKRLHQLSKMHADTAPIVSIYTDYKKLLEDIEEAELIIAEEDDDEFQDLAKQELETLVIQKEKLEEEIKILLIPKDPNDHRNVIVEIRAGTGGEEAGLFAAELFRMYSRHAEKSNWTVELLSQSATGLKGFKEVVFLIEGEDAYSKLKFEGGTHRVQRVPATETSGRIHTSAVTVAVLPEAEEVDIQIDQNDLRIDTFRSSGPGGQSVNTTDSAIRITHLPTNLVVSCQDEKSQHKNKAKAMKILRSRLLEITKSEQDAERAETRKTMIGSGDRSEKIRTYNFPQGRVTDHRIGLSIYQLESTLDGELDPFISSLISAEGAEKLKNLEA
ncbi:TPA: peptide chain release factor 1 [Candidatus Poribacteria bacterium]|nr:peptide chain release factor 1 [Candidatus Poribacteria bacterium]HIA68252.1 peptide chain release factor 1 [Candidatus Poribacteria bacterium]HIB89184.1 peptide chain release factor 1 [Candidatus Poribacteria bacterium]HIC02041.1 peptide chain release factor 1 [Candidatus Poribacteria bacterium]HIN28208.1 peptide chain release factor 1 [Candidatus Poribacteria bacterium]